MGASFVSIRHDLIPQKAVKGQAFAEFLAAHSVPEHLKLHEDIPDEVLESNVTSEDEVWQVFFDGASRIGPRARSLPAWGLCLSPHKITSFLEHSL